MSYKSGHLGYVLLGRALRLCLIRADTLILPGAYISPWAVTGISSSVVLLCQCRDIRSQGDGSKNGFLPL